VGEIFVGPTEHRPAGIPRGLSSPCGIIGDYTDIDRFYVTRKQEKRCSDPRFANADIGQFEPPGQIAEAYFGKMFGINIQDTLFTLKKASPPMAERASIMLDAAMQA